MSQLQVSLAHRQSWCHHLVLSALSLHLLTPKTEPMPRSITTPRSQPMSSYPLYFSLVFRRSQAPISVATKRLAQPRSLPSLRPQPRHPSSPVGYVSFPQTVTGQLPVIFTAHTPWQPEGNYIRRTIFHHQFSLVCTLIPHPFLIQPP